MSYVLEFLKALALTLAVEVPVLFIGAQYLLKPPSSKDLKPTLLLAGVLASSFTLPYLWFVLPHLFEDYTLFLIIGELSIFIFEAIFYFFLLELDWKKAALLSLLCNSASFLLGLLLQNLLH